MTTPAPLHSWEPEPELEGAGPLMFGATGAGGVQIVVSVAEVARRLGVDPTTLTVRQDEVITDAIVDCQADVIAKLNRPIFPRIELLEAQRPAIGYEVDDPKAYGLAERFNDTVAIVSVFPNVDDPDLQDLEVEVGLKGEDKPAIVRYVRAHAVESLRLDRVAQTVLGLEVAMTSVSADGQSITPEKRPTVAGAAGSLPTLDSLKQFRRTMAYSRPRAPRAPWPYYGS